MSNTSKLDFSSMRTGECTRIAMHICMAPGGTNRQWFTVPMPHTLSHGALHASSTLIRRHSSVAKARVTCSHLHELITVIAEVKMGCGVRDVAL